MLLRRNLVRAAMAAGLVLLGLPAVALEAKPAAAAGPTLTGTGSSYAAVAINQWVAQMDQFYGTNINYQTTSSVIGLNNFAQRQVDFGASEIGYSTNQADSTPPAGYRYQYMPTVAGATCLMYNLTSSTQQLVRNLNLSTAAMLGIFTGTVKRWNDPAIASSNPGVLLPNTPITVVFRTDPSGENYLFSQYFDILTPGEWGAFTSALSVAPGPTAIWPTPANASQVGRYNFAGWVGQSGSDNASNYVAATPQSITFVETAYAILHNSPCASIQNVSGAYVQPSARADAIALTHNQVYLDPNDPRYGEQDLTGVYTCPEVDCYPISAYSYLVTPAGQIDPVKGKLLGQFIAFIACRGQQAAGQLGYSPIPPNLIEVDFKAVSQLAGADPPPPLDAEHCPNPYLTGELSIPGGGPVVVGTGGTTGGQQALSADQQAALAAKARAKAAANAGKVPGAKDLITAGGQAPGLALNAAVARLLNLSGPTSVAVLSTLGFVALLLGPPALLAWRRRVARRPAPGQPVGDDDDEHKLTLEEVGR